MDVTATEHDDTRDNAREGEDRTNDLLFHSRRLVRTSSEAMLKPFATSSSSGTNIPYLDSLRGVAVLLVVVFHFWGGAGKPTILLPVPGGHIDLTPLIACGFVGVNLFFILSGFLLSQYFFKADFRGRPRPSLRTFFRHRFFRIVPGYYFCIFLLVLFLCPGFVNPNLVYSHEGILDLALHAVFLQDLLPTGVGQYNPALWTLTLEMLFYLSLPFVIPLFFRNRWLFGLVVCTALSYLWVVAGAHAPQPLIDVLQSGYARVFHQTKYPNTVNEYAVRVILDHQLPSYYFQFCFGIVVANFYTRVQMQYQVRRWLRVVTSTWAGLLYLVTGTALVLWSMHNLGESFITGKFIAYPSFAESPMTLGFTLMLAGLLWSGAWIKSVASFAPLRLIGIISYSIYLWHLPVLFVTLNLPAVAAATTAGEKYRSIMWHASLMTLAVSILFYLTIEKPFILLGRKPSGTAVPRQFSPAGISPIPALPVEAERATAHD